MNSPQRRNTETNSLWRNAFLAAGVVAVVIFVWIATPALLVLVVSFVIPELPPRAYRNNQHELLPDGRSVDLIFKGHDAIDGSFLVQTSRHKGLLSVPLKSKPLALAAEPDLRILPNGRAVIFIKNKTTKEPLQMGLDEFLEGVAEVPEYNTVNQSK